MRCLLRQRLQMAGFTSELVARCTVLGSDLVIQNGTKSEGAADLHAGSSDSSPELITWEGANKNSARTQKQIAREAAGCKLLILLEAAIGIEPMNKGFADLCLTTWLRRRLKG